MNLSRIATFALQADREINGLTDAVRLLKEAMAAMEDGHDAADASRVKHTILPNVEKRLAEAKDRKTNIAKALERERAENPNG